MALFAPPDRDTKEIALKKDSALFGAICDAFGAGDGFDEPVRVNWIDGVRIYFNNGDIAHIRPSGNAPQLRIYACANTQERADDIVRRAVAEPSGILRTLESKI